MDEGEPVAGVSSSLSSYFSSFSSSCPGSQFSSLHASVRFTSPLPLSEMRFHIAAIIKEVNASESNHPHPDQQHHNITTTSQQHRA